ncbi:MAG: hypothetical protein JST61_08175 [Acidobacteria bacterium]|nr:hypothetical protein [Acidobacteriota bacterium]
MIFTPEKIVHRTWNEASGNSRSGQFLMDESEFVPGCVILSERSESKDLRSA